MSCWLASPVSTVLEVLAVTEMCDALGPGVDELPAILWTLVVFALPELGVSESLGMLELVEVPEALDPLVVEAGGRASEDQKTCSHCVFVGPLRVCKRCKATLIL